jgi:hypothetical protein
MNSTTRATAAAAPRLKARPAGRTADDPPIAITTIPAVASRPRMTLRAT